MFRLDRRKIHIYTERHKRRLLKKQTAEDISKIDLPHNSNVQNPSKEKTGDTSSSDSASLSDDVYFDEDCDTFASNRSTQTASKSSKLNDQCSKEQLYTALQNWAVQNGITLVALTSLLKLLQSYVQFELPNDARTLLQTPRNVDSISNINGGQYWHFGLRNVLHLIHEDFLQAKQDCTEIKLIFNVDGLPLSKSSTACFWPILVSEPILRKVYIVGSFFGHEKPKNSNEFLQPFVTL